VTIAVRATPRAARDAIEGVRTGDDGRSWLAVRLTAAPSDGEANDALIRLLAKALGVRRGDVRLTSGTTSRMKRIFVGGDPQELGKALSKLIEGTE
jgi:uncharacterized protein (TIGR00251 family)